MRQVGKRKIKKYIFSLVVLLELFFTLFAMKELQPQPIQALERTDQQMFCTKFLNQGLFWRIISTNASPRNYPKEISCSMRGSDFETKTLRKCLKIQPLIPSMGQFEVYQFFKGEACHFYTGHFIFHIFFLNFPGSFPSLLIFSFRLV